MSLCLHGKCKNKAKFAWTDSGSGTIERMCTKHTPAYRRSHKNLEHMREIDKRASARKK